MFLYFQICLKCKKHLPFVECFFVLAHSCSNSTIFKPFFPSLHCQTDKMPRQCLAQRQSWIIFHYLEDNTKHLIFWLCNMKQLNFRHFNTTSKKFTVTVNFFQKETKTAQKRPILFCLVYQGVFDHFATIPDYFRRFPKTTKDVRRLPKMSKDNRRFPRRNPKIFQKQIRFDNAERL